jgi:hypothetical protein
MGRRKILKIAAENDGPFYCTVEKGKDDHIGTPRFLEGGGPIPKIAAMIESQIATPEAVASPSKETAQIPTTGDLPFPPNEE